VELEPDAMTAAARHLEHRIADLQPELLAFLRRRSPGAEEELAQDVWLRVVQAAPDISEDTAFRAYCFTVARRVLVDGHRRRLARAQLVAVDDLDARAGSAPRADDILHARAVLETVEAELDAMRPEIAEVFRERTSGASSFKDIAARQGVPLNTALGRMHRATRRIAEALRARDLIGDDHDR
jgi:RNA polymerase sigma-70 factor (ECF subfamily)